MIVSYDAVLVLLSILVAIAGSLTGLMITCGLTSLGGASYKLKIVAGAVAIGTSIWSMHFIGMLALSAPVPIGYDSLETTISAFIAISLTGLGLYAASSGHLGRFSLPAGGLLMGGGIAGMHYLGMNAIRADCVVSYAPAGVVCATLAGIASSTLALWFAFRVRSPLETAAGAVLLGLSISAMHYIAMLATAFSETGNVTVLPNTVLSQHGVAFIVAVVTFLICGLFLIMALPDKIAPVPHDGTGRLGADLLEQSPGAHGDMTSGGEWPPAIRVPVRRNHATYFAAADAILAVRAEGHYSKIALRSKSGSVDEHFCEHSISELAKLLEGSHFVRPHRSHLVNIGHVLGYRRQGDGGLLLLNEEGSFSVPVSRAKVHTILQELKGRTAHLQTSEIVST